MADESHPQSLGAAELQAALTQDLAQISAKYRGMLNQTYVGAAVCLSDYGAGTLAAMTQDENQPLDAALAMAMSLLDASRSDEVHPQVTALLNRARKLVKTAIDLKTGQTLATHSLH